MVSTVNPYLLGRGRWQVVASAIVARTISGKESYHYRDSLLPADVSPAEFERLEGLGLIRRITEGEPK